MKRILMAVAMMSLTGGAYAGGGSAFEGLKAAAAGVPAVTVPVVKASPAAAAVSSRSAAGKNNKLYPHSCFRKGHSLVETRQFDQASVGEKVKARQFAQLDDLERIFLFNLAHQSPREPYVEKGEFSEIAIFLEAGADNSLVFYTAPAGSYSETIAGVGIRFFAVPVENRTELYRFTPEEMLASADAAPGCR